MFGFSEIRPLLPEEWAYPQDMSAIGAINYNGKVVTMPRDATSYRVIYQGSRFKQTGAPIIRVATNSMFDLRYLPMIAVTEYRPTVEYSGNGFTGAFVSTTVEGFEYDLMYLIPWQNAKVYYTTAKEDPNKWNPINGAYGTLVSGGFGAISTERSKQNGRYTLVTEMDFGGSGNKITVFCSIDIV